MKLAKITLNATMVGLHASLLVLGFGVILGLGATPLILTASALVGSLVSLKVLTFQIKENS